MTDYAEDFLGLSGTQPHEDDKRLFVTFSYEPRLDQEATAAAGYNKYKDIPYVTIRIPGDKTLAVHRPIMPSDKHRFPQQYAAFASNTPNELAAGTPLTLWPSLTPSQVKELEYFNIKTVEQLAAMPDSGGGQLMGVQAMKRAAKAYIEAAKSQAPLLAVQKELETRDNEIAALKAAQEEQSRLISRLIGDKDESKVASANTTLKLSK